MVTVVAPLAGVAKENKQNVQITELQGLNTKLTTVIGQLAQQLTDGQLRASDVKITLDGEKVALDAATLAALEDVNVTVTNQLSNVATQTTLAALLTELQAKADLTETQPVNVTNLPVSQTVNDGGGSLTVDGTVAVTGTQQDALTNAQLRAADVKITLDGEEIKLDPTSLAALEDINVTVTNQLTNVATQTTLAALLAELQTQQKNALTNTELRAADVKITLDGEPVALDATTLAALEDVSVTVNNQITGFATQTTLAAVLTELQTQQKNALTDAQLRASDVKVTLDGEEIRLDPTSLAALEDINVTVTNQLTNVATETTLLALLFELQTQQRNALTNTELRASDVKITLDGEAVALDAATLAALEDISVTVNNPITNYATQTTLAALLTELQTQQKNALTNAELRATPVPTSVTGTADTRIVGHTVRTPISPVNSKKKSQVNIGTTPVRVLVTPLANRTTLAIRNMDDKVQLFYGHTNLISPTAGTMLIDPKDIYVDEIGPGIQTWLVSAGRSLGTNIQTNDGTSTTNVVNVTTPNNLLVNNPSAATFTALNSTLDMPVSAFTHVPPHTAIQSVKLKVRMNKPQGGGTDPTMRMEYLVNGVLGDTSLTAMLPTGGATEYEVDITTDREWVASEIAQTVVRLTQTGHVDRPSNVEYLRVEVVEVELGGLIRVALDESAETI